MTTSSLIGTIVLLHIRLYLRNGAAIFWTFMFPIILLIILMSVYGTEGRTLMEAAELESRQRGNLGLISRYPNLYFVTGLIVLFIFMTSIFAYAIPLALLRETGGTKMYVVMPISKWDFLLGYFLSRLFIVAGFVAVIFVVSDWIYGFGITYEWKSAVAFACTVLAGTVAFLSICSGLISTIKSVALGSLLANVIYYPSLFLSDLVIPIDRFPDAVQDVAQWSPTYVLATTMRAAVLGELDFQMTGDALVHFVIWTILGQVLVLRHFEWTTQN